MSSLDFLRRTPFGAYLGRSRNWVERMAIAGIPVVLVGAFVLMGLLPSDSDLHAAAPAGAALYIIVTILSVRIIRRARSDGENRIAGIAIEAIPLIVVLVCAVTALAPISDKGKLVLTLAAVAYALTTILASWISRCIQSPKSGK